MSKKDPTNPQQPPAADPSGWVLARHVPTLARLAATGLGVYLCTLLALPFLSALVWALALAVMFTPWQRWLETKTGRPNLAALLATGVVGLIVAVPLTLVGQRLVHELGQGAELIKAKAESGAWRQVIEAHPRLAPLAAWVERQDLPATIEALAGWMTTTGASFVRGSLAELAGMLLTFYLLFFFLRDRRAVLRLLQRLSPLPEADMVRLCGRVGDTIYATVYGTVVVSAAQGLLGGLMFWWLGLPAPLFWGMVMALLAVLPAFGAFVVWIPATLYLAMDDSWGKALLLAGWGAAVVGTVDNLLRPLLVGRRLKLHPIVVFVSVVGGVVVFGAAGLVLGPIVLTVTQELLETWSRRAPAGAAAKAP